MVKLKTDTGEDEITTALSELTAQTDASRKKDVAEAKKDLVSFFKTHKEFYEEFSYAIEMVNKEREAALKQMEFVKDFAASLSGLKRSGDLSKETPLPPLSEVNPTYLPEPDYHEIFISVVIKRLDRQTNKKLAALEEVMKKDNHDAPLETPLKLGLFGSPRPRRDLMVTLEKLTKPSKEQAELKKLLDRYLPLVMHDAVNELAHKIIASQEQIRVADAAQKMESAAKATDKV